MSQSKLSIWSASRSGTVSVSEIFANDRREFSRVFLRGCEGDALRAAAKGITSVSPVGHGVRNMRIATSVINVQADRNMKAVQSEVQLSTLRHFFVFV